MYMSLLETQYEAYQDVRQQIEVAAELTKNYFNPHVKGCKFEIGHWVWVYTIQPKKVQRVYPKMDEELQRADASDQGPWTSQLRYTLQQTNNYNYCTCQNVEAFHWRSSFLDGKQQMERVKMMGMTTEKIVLILTVQRRAKTAINLLDAFR